MLCGRNNNFFPFSIYLCIFEDKCVFCEFHRAVAVFVHPLNEVVSVLCRYSCREECAQSAACFKSDGIAKLCGKGIVGKECNGGIPLCIYMHIGRNHSVFGKYLFSSVTCIIPVCKFVACLCGVCRKCLARLLKRFALLDIFNNGCSVAVVGMEGYVIILCNSTSATGNSRIYNRGCGLLFLTCSGINSALHISVVVSKTCTRCSTAGNCSVKEACGSVVNSVLEVCFIAVMVEVYGTVEVICDNKVILCHISQGNKTFTAAEYDSALDNNVFKSNVCCSDTVTDDEVAVDNRGVKMNIVTCEDNFALAVADSNRAARSNISRKDVEHYLCKLFSCYVVVGTNGGVLITVEVSAKNKACNRTLCKIADVILVDKAVKKMRIFGVDDKCSCDYKNSFLTSDGIFGMHRAVFITREGSHVDSLCHFFVIPFVGSNVGILARNISLNLCTEGSVHDGSHFGTGKELLRAHRRISVTGNKSVFHSVCHCGLRPTCREVDKAVSVLISRCGKRRQGQTANNKDHRQNKRQHALKIFHAFHPFSFCLLRH